LSASVLGGGQTPTATTFADAAAFIFFFHIECASCEQLDATSASVEAEPLGAAFKAIFGHLNIALTLALTPVPMATPPDGAPFPAMFRRGTDSGRLVMTTGTLVLKLQSSKLLSEFIDAQVLALSSGLDCGA